MNPADTQASDSLSFRTLGGEHTIALLPNETPEQAVARYLRVDQRRVVLQMLDHEAFVILLAPLEIYHDPLTASYASPPGFLELYRQNLHKFEYKHWSVLSTNPGIMELLEDNIDQVQWRALCSNPNARAVELIESSIRTGDSTSSRVNDIDWTALCGNPSSTPQLLGLCGSRTKIIWYKVCQNTNAEVFKMILKFPNIAKLQTILACPLELNWTCLSANPNAIDVLADNLHAVDSSAISLNPNAIELLADYVELIDWQNFANNPNPKAIEVMEANLDKVDWIALSRNPNAIELLSANLDQVSWYFLSSNPKAIDLLSANMDQVDWDALSSNPNAIHLLEANIDRVNWGMLCRNPNGVGLLSSNFEQIKEKINWTWLSCNPSAAELLKANPDHIDWDVCCQAMPWTEIRQ